MTQERQKPIGLTYKEARQIVEERVMACPKDSESGMGKGLRKRHFFDAEVLLRRVYGMRETDC